MGHQLTALTNDVDVDESEADVLNESIIRAEPKIGRNDPCPCGSGKKYKKCCLNRMNGDRVLN
jgi:preprotein translocase subunit SecA